MATKDFRASQVETSKIIGSGSISGTTVGIAIYSGSIASNREGGVVSPHNTKMFENVGTDVFLFVSGTRSNNNFNRTDATLFGGDVVISGTLYAERQVIEVDSVADGNFFVTGNMYVEPDTDSTESVAFRDASGTELFRIDTTNKSIIGGYNSTSTGDYNFIGSGLTNVINTGTDYAFLGGGQLNQIFQTDDHAVLVGGKANLNNATAAVIVGGQNLTASGDYGFMGGGDTNNMGTGGYQVIVGGKSNTMANGSTYASIVGGTSNSAAATGDYGFIGGGESNTLNGRWTGILGGKSNTAWGEYSQIISTTGSQTLKNHTVAIGTHIIPGKTNSVHIGGGNNSTGHEVVVSGAFYVENRKLYGSSGPAGGYGFVVGDSSTGVGVGPVPGNKNISNLAGVGVDVNVLISGTVGSRGGATQGATLAAGDLIVSGATYLNNSLFVGTDSNVAVDINTSTLDIDATGAISIDGTAAIGITSTATDTTIKSTGARVVLSGSSGSDSVLVQSDMEIVGSLHGASPLKINDDIALTGSARFKEQSAPTAGPNEAVLYAKDVSGVSKLFTKQSDGLEVGPLGSGGALDDAYDTPIGGGTKATGVGAVITADGQPVQIKVAGASNIGLAVTGSVIFGSGSTGLGSSGLPAMPGTDTHFFVSGSKGGRGSFGSSVFGGDLIVSGNTRLHGNMIIGGTGDGTDSIFFDGGGGNSGPWIRGNTQVLTIDGDNRVDIRFDEQVKFAGSAGTSEIVQIFDPTATSLIETQRDALQIFSGSIGSRGTTTRGASVFGGDTVISGTLAKVDSVDGSLVAEIGNPGIIMPPNKVIEFGDPGENIKGDGTDLFISSSRKAYIVATGDVVIDSSDNVSFERGGTEFFRIKRSSGDAVFQPKESNKDIVFKEDGGDEVFRVDSDVKNILMAAGNNVTFGAATRYIGDGTDYNSTATDVVVVGSNNVILGPGANSQAFVSLGTNGQFVVADGAAPTNYLMITGSGLGGILSSSVHNKNISIHSNNSRESFSITGTGNAVFNDPGPAGTDTVFSVSGSIGSRGTTTPGTAVFGGDVVTSGTLRQAGSLHVYNQGMTLQNGDRFFSPFQGGAITPASSVDNVKMHTLIPYSGSLERVTIATRLGGQIVGGTVGLYVNGVLAGEMTGSTPSGATAVGGLTGTRIATFDFTGKSSTTVSGSVIFNANDFVTMQINGRRSNDATVTTVFRLNDLVDPDEILLP